MKMRWQTAGQRSKPPPVPTKPSFLRGLLLGPHEAKDPNPTLWIFTSFVDALIPSSLAAALHINSESDQAISLQHLHRYDGSF